jgi:hypothetical protein
MSPKEIEALQQQLSMHIWHLKDHNTLEERKDFNAHRNGLLEIIDGNIDFLDIASYINTALYDELLLDNRTTILNNFENYKLKIHSLLLQKPTEDNQQQVFKYLTS